ncbi:MAG TPA: hypothetical protein VIK92_02530 [Thermaerobacter sp.]
MSRPGAPSEWEHRLLLLERRVVTLRRSRRVLLELLACQEERYAREVDELRRRVDQLERQRRRLLAFIRRRAVMQGTRGQPGAAGGGRPR